MIIFFSYYNLSNGIHKCIIISFLFLIKSGTIKNDQRREEKEENKEQSKWTNIVSNKKKEEKERTKAKQIRKGKYKTVHIHTSWYAPLDSFISLALSILSLLQLI